MDGIIAVFFVNEGVQNTDVLFSVFQASGPSPVCHQQKQIHQACFKQTVWFHLLVFNPGVIYLCPNVYTSRPRPGSSGHTVTYSPILYLKLVLYPLEQSRSMHETFVTQTQITSHIFELTNWRKVFSVCEPQS